MDPVLLKRFTSPDETRSFEKGTFEVVRLGGLTVGRASYEPGWKWSTHVGPLVGLSLCQVAHVGMVMAGRAMVAMEVHCSTKNLTQQCVQLVVRNS